MIVVVVFGVVLWVVDVNVFGVVLWCGVELVVVLMGGVEVLGIIVLVLWVVVGVVD